MHRFSPMGGVLALALSGACASINGATDDLDSTYDPSGSGSDAGVSGAAGAANAGAGASSTGGASTGGGSVSTGGASGGEPGTGASAGGVDAGGATTGGSGGGTSASTGGSGGAATSGEGTCASPLELGFTGNRASYSGTTVGGPETLSPKCAPNDLVSTAVPGPDRVFHFTVPQTSEATVQATGNNLQFVASVYALTSCGNSATELSCDYAGDLVFNAQAGTDYFLYVDSGATNNLLLGQLTDEAGPFSLSITLRQLVGEGEACGTSGTSPKCDVGTLACRAEGGSNVCRAIRCGDGFLEGSEQCDDQNSDPLDGCDQCQVSCAMVIPLALRAQGTSRVATAAGDNVGGADVLKLSCTGTGGAERVYSFTLDATSMVRVDLAPASGFDAQLALLAGACSVTGERSCKDSGGAGSYETIEMSLSAGTHYVVVEGYDGDTGNYDLTVTATP